MSGEDQDAVWAWYSKKELEIRKYSSWTDCIERQLGEIRSGRRRKSEENRKRRLKERGENTPPLPEDLEEWCDRRLFFGEHFLYYKRHGRYADVCCSKCGTVTTIATKRKNTFEGQFERVIDPPANGSTGRCPACGAFGTWKAQGKTKGVYALDKYFFIGMPYKNTGAVIRYVECEKMFSMDEMTDGKSLVMTGASERYIITEIARWYILPGRKKTQTDYHKYSSYTGNFWDDCNLYGMNNIPIKEGIIYEKTWKMLKGTVLQYSGAEEYQKTCSRFNLMDYMERYIQWPQIEMFTKMGLTKIVTAMVSGYCGIVADQYASRPEDFLGIYKERMKLLISKNGDTEYLEAMRMERRMDMHWSDEALLMIKETGIRQIDLELALRYMSMKQLQNRLEKYSGCTFLADETLCSRASAVLKNITRTYFDYLNMRQQRGYDLHNTVFLWPKNLQRAHDLMVAEVNEARMEKREQEVAEKYPDIRRRYRKLRNQYFFEDAELLIRPARSAEEIVREGRALHHCVGGDTYLSRHNDGTNFILFLRAKEAPETPYITVEINGTKIVQWYGAYDKKPDQVNMEKWLGGYTEHLKEKAREEKARVAAIA